MNILDRSIKFYLAADADAGGTAVLDAPNAKPPVTPPGETSLAEEFKKTLKQQQKAIQQPEPKNPDAKATEPEVKKPDVVKEEAKKEEPVNRPASPLEAALAEPKVEAKAETAETEIPLNAPAKLLREAMERHKAEATKWKSEAEKAKGGDPATKQELAVLKEQFEKTKAENAELRDAITAVNVEYDPAVRAKFHDGKKSLIEKTTSEVERFGGDAKAFTEAMELPRGKARTQALKLALENVDELDRPTIHNKLAKIADLEEEHADLLKNSQRSFEELTKQQQQRALQQQEQVEKAKAEIFDKVSKAITSKNPTLRFVGEDIEGHEAWNAGLKEAHQRALQKLGPDADLESITETAIKGERLDFVESLLLDERSETARLREELKQYQSAEPGFEGRNKNTVTSNLDKTPAQVYREKLAELSGKGQD